MTTEPMPVPLLTETVCIAVPSAATLVAPRLVPVPLGPLNAVRVNWAPLLEPAEIETLCTVPVKVMVSGRVARLPSWWTPVPVLLKARKFGVVPPVRPKPESHGTVGLA